MKKKKYSFTKILRVGVQAAFFILLPGLFASVFSSIRQVAASLVQGTFSVQAYAFQLVMIVSVLFVTLLFGRIFCGWMCAFGSFGDFLYYLRTKLIKRKTKIGKKTDAALKYLKYAVLLAVIVFVWTLNNDFSQADPWTVFGLLASTSFFSSLGLVLKSYLAGLIILLAIFAGMFFIERFFCRYLCPLGAIFSVVSLPRAFSIKKKRDHCNRCSACASKCVMHLDMAAKDKVVSGECVACGKCVEVCPNKNAKASFLGIKMPIAAVCLAAVALTAALYIGGMKWAVSLQNEPAVSAPQSETAAGAYKDGVYTGTGTGYKGEVALNVTVENGSITAVTVTSYRDDAQYFTRASSQIIPQVIAAQSADVDAVSGATFSSEGIIEAVEEALSQAE